MDTRTQSCRQIFVSFLFPELISFRYAYMNFFYDDFDQIPTHSEIELFVDKSEIPKWRSMFDNVSYIQDVIFTEKSFCLFVKLNFNDGSCLGLKLVHTMKWKHLAFMDVEQVLRSVRPNDHRVKVPPIEKSFEYIFLYFSLNNRPIPEKYEAYFNSLDAETIYKINRHIVKKYRLGGNVVSHLFELPLKRKFLLKTLKKQPANRGWQGLKNLVAYLGDVLERPQEVVYDGGVLAPH